jgi:CheY-like chemotaxis protein
VKNKQSTSQSGDSLMRNAMPKILVVDDEGGIRLTLAMILAVHGYETATAFSGEEAVQVASSFQPDCIVSDVMMGEVNGIDAAIEILHVLPNCKVLLISGNAGYGDLLEKARAKGFDFELLLKPVPPPDLLTKISQMLPRAADQLGGHCAHGTYTFPTIATSSRLLGLR